jgi:hypothetical protein
MATSPRDKKIYRPNPEVVTRINTLRDTLHRLPTPQEYAAHYNLPLLRAYIDLALTKSPVYIHNHFHVFRVHGDLLEPYLYDNIIVKRRPLYVVAAELGITPSALQDHLFTLFPHYVPGSPATNCPYCGVPIYSHQNCCRECAQAHRVPVFTNS